ncbi:MAG: hypothetical protein HYY17_03200 [Planctomycetes bacterium]|nr:hypothetical protein [Planctomycetota bacterium]
MFAIAFAATLALQQDPDLAEFRKLHEDCQAAEKAGKKELAEKLADRMREKLHAALREHIDAVQAKDEKRQERTFPRVVEMARILTGELLPPEAFKPRWVLEYLYLLSADAATTRASYLKAKNDLAAAMKRMGVTEGFQSILPPPLPPKDDDVIFRLR